MGFKNNFQLKKTPQTTKSVIKSYRAFDMAFSLRQLECISTDGGLWVVGFSPLTLVVTYSFTGKKRKIKRYNMKTFI